MIPLCVPNLSGNEAKYLEECVRSTFVSTIGPFVNQFEEMVAETSGARYSVATSSGTAGLQLALLSVGVKRDDLVIVPSFTFIASANAIDHCGAEPWLLDVDQDTWHIDCQQLKQLLKDETIRQGDHIFHKVTRQRISAIMPVYTLGLPADMDVIQEVVEEYQLPIVADGAAAVGATYKGRPLGELADLTVFSFNGNKIATSGGGGAVVGNQESLLEQVRHLSTTARIGPDYHHDQVGYNYRMTNLQAAVGCAQMEQLHHFLRAKRRIRNTYNKAFGDVKGVRLFPETSWAEGTCWFSGILLDKDVQPPLKSLCQHLIENGIEARSFWKPIHLQPPYKNAPSTDQRVANLIWDSILTLPSSTHLTEKEQNHVTKVLQNKFN